MGNPKGITTPVTLLSNRATRITGGVLRDRTCKNIENLFRRIDVEALKAVYATPHDSWFAEPEFCGQYLDTAIELYRTTGDESILTGARELVRSIIENQREDGYLGTYHRGLEFEETFGVWNQNFTIMGLLSYFEETEDQAALECTCRCADYLASNFMGVDGPDLFSCVNQGIEHSCLIHQMPRLYALTGRQLYLDFSLFLIEKLESTATKLVTIPLESVNPISTLGCCKAAEILICYQGLVDLHAVTGEDRYLQAAARYWETVNRTQIGITGNGSILELWNYWGNKVLSPSMDVRPNENCVAVCWMKLGAKLFERLGESKYIDAVERTLYNHLLGSQALDGHDFSYYQALHGRKVHEKHPGQYSCCRYRGMSMLAHLPRYVYAKEGNEVQVLLHCGSETALEMHGADVSLSQATDFPRSGTIEIELQPAKDIRFPLKLRIPEWSAVRSVRVDGRELETRQDAGYCVIDRKWPRGGTVVIVELAMPVGSVEGTVEDRPCLACTYGPLVLALDSRYGTPIEDTEIMLEAGIPSLGPEPLPADVWSPMVRFAARGRHRGGVRDITLVDYASAGSVDPAADRFRVWMPFGV